MQAKSGDGYAHIPTSALSTIQLTHLVSERDLSIALPEGAGATLTGLTEWVGSWCGMTLSVGWDWAVVEGALVVLNPQEIRTNIQLIAATGDPEPTEVARIRLLHWIESMPWRELIRRRLLVGEPRLP
jgi:hypothetical protein